MMRTGGTCSSLGKSWLVLVFLFDIFFLFTFLGMTPMYTCAQAYLDENVAQAKSAINLGNFICKHLHDLIFNLYPTFSFILRYFLRLFSCWRHAGIHFLWT